MACAPYPIVASKLSARVLLLRGSGWGAGKKPATGNTLMRLVEHDHESRHPREASSHVASAGHMAHMH